MKRILSLIVAAALTGIACSKKAEEAPKAEPGSERTAAAGIYKDGLDELFKHPKLARADALPKGIQWLTNDSDPVFASPNAKKGGTYYTYMDSFPLTLRTVGPDSNGSFRSFLFDNQMDLLHIHPETGNLTPGLATHWATNKEQNTLYLKLDERARWSDGVPVSAYDVAFSLKFYLSKEIVAPWYNTQYGEEYDTITVFDDHTVAIKSVNKRNLQDLVYYATMEIRPRHFHEKLLDKDWVKNTNWMIEPNTGPYQISKIEKGKFVTFARKKDWWAKDLKYFKNRFNTDFTKVTVIRDPNVVFEHFKKGMIDALPLVIPEYWHNKATGEPFDKGYIEKVWFYHQRPQPIYGVYFNQDVEILKDKDVRIGISHALNIDKVLKTVLRGDYVRMETNTLGHGAMDNKTIKGRRFDLAKADAHFKKAGWAERGPDGIRVKNGKRLSLRVTYGYATHADRLVILKEEAKKAGLELTLQKLDGAASFKAMLEKQHEIAYTGWGAQDRMQYWGQYHSDNAHKTQTNNFGNVDDKVLDPWLVAYKDEFDLKKKAELAHKIQQRIHDEAYTVTLWAAPYIRFGHWRWMRFPDPVASMRSKDATTYPFDGDWGGVFWIDEDIKKETQAAMKAGKGFPPVTLIDTRHKRG
ncbi:MAG: ABC transporter substrate-binding protein [Elusimicrobia bacterium CG_4_9_14_3_um_filter_62_55]|nr:MAG: ABC transporter substrate-binding protein [Elusimicrobia bacterium CG22_combo_CG10-13_8_21_14_all_63_91]PJA15373.1 MAG: ABC transporter substrate-binding protein [Elusimicrobia bacterium CG_4_10_14_0_2_um_filter_63_34]PJB26942.1 MAG: ABC transporter substrate-binding protein [Elusimicrobia bacterium CG_4_9_14_3_um_filter_62_55]